MDKHILERRMIPYREASVDLATIDLETGGQHGLQNREQAVAPEEVVLDYTAAWLRDDPIPPVILWEIPEHPQTYMPIDGYTRIVAAERAQRDQVAAIIAECDKEMAAQLSYEANSRHGRQASREFRIVSAVKLTEQGVSIKEAAARLNLPVDLVADKRTVARARERALRLDIKGMNKVSDHMMKKIQPVEIDSAFKAIGELVRDGGSTLTGARLEALTKEVRGARSEADMLAIIEGERAELGVTQMDEAAAKAAQPWLRLNKVVTQVRQVDLSEAVKAARMAGYTASEVQDLLSRMREIVAGLTAVIADIYGDA